MPLRLLIVDDNPLVREVVHRMLAARGFDVETAEDGPQALELAAQRSFDAALVDVDMPRMNGVEVCRELQRGAAAEHPLFVWLMTGLTRPDLETAARLAGARGVISKPFTLGELMNRLEQDLPVQAVA